jgi:hypothetical protein
VKQPTYAKLCIDCQFIETDDPAKASFVKCLHPRSLKLNEYLVTGDVRNREYYHFASTERIESGHCGYNGRLWRPRYPIINVDLLVQPAKQHRWYSRWFKTKQTASVN